MSRSQRIVIVIVGFFLAAIGWVACSSGKKAEVPESTPAASQPEKAEEEAEAAEESGAGEYDIETDEERKNIELGLEGSGSGDIVIEGADESATPAASTADAGMTASDAGTTRSAPPADAGTPGTVGDASADAGRSDAGESNGISIE